MINPPIWDSSIVDEEDRYIAEVKINGEIPKNSLLICSASKSAKFLLKGIVADQKPVGTIDVIINEVVNAYEYINGDKPQLSYFKTVQHQYYSINNATIIIYNDINTDINLLVKSTFDFFKPQEVIVFDSTHQSLYRSELEDIPSLFILSTFQKNTVSPPNVVIGISAGFLTYSSAYNVKCTVYYLIEDNSGFSSQSMSLWAKIVTPMFHIEEERLIDAAIKKAVIASSHLNILYS